MSKRKNKGRPKSHPKAKGQPPQHTRPRFNSKGNRDDSPFARPHTLAEEARNTASNRRGFRGRDARLRSQPVVFISAGFMDPLKDCEISKHPHSSTTKERAPDSNPEAGDRPSPNALEAGVSHIDLADNGDTAQRETNQLQDERSAIHSDVDSDSSDEVILFKGRDAARQQQEPPSPKPTRSIIESTGTGVSQETKQNLTIVKETTDVAVTSDSGLQIDDLDFISLEPRRTKHVSSRQHRLTMDEEEEDEEAAIIADYIANTQNGFDDDGSDDEEDVAHPGLGSHSFSILRDLGGTDSDAIPSQPSSEGDSENDTGDDSEEEETECELAVEDERLARLLAKQEELGFGGDDVLLLDGADADDGWIAATSMPRRKTKRGSKKSRLFQGGSQFPNATKMAEAFDELDLIDMQGSRLQRSKKGPISFGLSDSELEDALNVAIKKDRLKKADKKKAREELRSQGLLGKNVNPSDLRVKYQGGMSLDDLAEEFEAFMLSTREQCVALEY
ncbi:hypothetical protein NPX13_g11045 [Xylaria arbuscula]|uniref:Uncharacterized protein n=1 Tax=Xylaria arbuscula TaxID=114810 RepID=A0A9W8TGW8_9PEZI|nr:hypothetical protein NPX13_g11045 [Xylaria arbuscula]